MQATEIYTQYMYSYPHKTAYRPLEDVVLAPYFEHLRQGENTLYVHIPFCQAKCGYCNLFSITGADDAYIGRYLTQLGRQLAQYNDVLPLHEVSWSAIVLGGGTPALLKLDQMERLFSMLEYYLDLDLSDCYTVIEAAPQQCNPRKLRYLKERGVSRISLGVQSFYNHELRSIGRIHYAEQSREALQQIQLLDFESCNIDLIYGLPRQDWDDLRYSAEQAVAFEPDEIFIYPLYVKPQTALYGKIQTDGALQYRLYQELRDYLLTAGYAQTSMRQFVKTLPAEPSGCGFESMLALGCGGRSYLGPLHFCEPFGVQPDHCRLILDHYLARADFMTEINGYLLNEDELKRRYLLKNLLYYRGVSLKDYQAHFQAALLSDFPQVATLMEKKYAVLEAGQFHLTPLGLSLSDYIGPMFISPTVREQMAEYILC